MLTAEKVIRDMYLLPIEEREKVARHIVDFGIKGHAKDAPEILDIEAWQNEIAAKPFNLKEASEYLGVSSVTLRRWVKDGRVPGYKIGRAYTFDVTDLREIKKGHATRRSPQKPS
ncbi:MAG: helix-turn-helix domain-containing protein [Thermodesulfobacteriota bacterium]|nr:helix-turn-helix domain-containing protein [Thermodesulfobacteriota bacterium]